MARSGRQNPNKKKKIVQSTFVVVKKNATPNRILYVVNLPMHCATKSNTNSRLSFKQHNIINWLTIWTEFPPINCNIWHLNQTRIIFLCACSHITISPFDYWRCVKKCQKTNRFGGQMVNLRYAQFSIGFTVTPSRRLSHIFPKIIHAH